MLRSVMPDASNLTFEEVTEIIALIRHAVDADKFGHSDRISRLRSALAKLDPLPPGPVPRRPPSPMRNNRGG